MKHRCPACQRAFDEAGYCPFDGQPLIAPGASAAHAAHADKPTLLEDPGSGAHRTEVEPRLRTFPITPTPVAAKPTQMAPVTKPADPPPPAAMRAVSAADSPQQALSIVTAGGSAAGGDEYDRLVGQTLEGRYLVTKKIGEGGMGVVFAARHAVIERPLAIKVLKREVMRDKATILRFVQEAKAASRIGHPNIVDVTDFGTTPDGMTYSVMEYVDGQTLGAALRADAPFPVARAIRITAQIARALGAAHDKGIVHRDLKPENVFLLDRDGRPDFVKIVDFGIAKVTPVGGANPNEPRLTRAGSVFGTPEYMAPEQAAGRGDLDGRVDVYALGVLLYEMLTGRVPHRGDTMVRTLAMQMLDPIEPPSKVRPDLAIGPELEALVMKLLAKKRDERFASMAAVLEGIDRLQTPVGTSITGSPVYALTPLPPGADPSAVAPPDAPTTPPLDAPPDVAPAAEPERPKRPTHRRHEPQFVAADKPLTFEHVFAEEQAPPRARRWPLLLALVVLLGGGAAAATWWLQQDRDDGGEPLAPDPDRATATRAPGQTGQTGETGQTGQTGQTGSGAAPDAAQIAEAPADAAGTPADAPELVFVELDAGARVPPRRRDAGVAVVLPPSGRVMIQVLTRPEGATLYVNNTYRGPGGTLLEEPFGTKLEIVCKHPGYKPGKVRLVFDGTQEAQLCVLERVKVCNPDIKNPFDDCP